MHLRAHHLLFLKSTSGLVGKIKIVVWQKGQQKNLALLLSKNKNVYRICSMKFKLLTKVTNIIQGPFTQWWICNQCVEKRGIPFISLFEWCICFSSKINAVLFFRTVLRLNLLTFQKPLSETTLARFLQQLPLLFGDKSSQILASGEACNNRVYDMHGRFFTQIKQADCLFNS
jgi:hypothetical protein